MLKIPKLSRLCDDDAAGVFLMELNSLARGGFDEETKKPRIARESLGKSKYQPTCVAKINPAVIIERVEDANTEPPMAIFGRTCAKEIVAYPIKVLSSGIQINMIAFKREI